MKYLILSLILAFGCRQNQIHQSGFRPVFRLDSHREEFNTELITMNRIQLLHQVYLNKLDKKNYRDNVLKNNFKKDSPEYLTSFAKLVVSYSDHEQVFYVPQNSDPKWLLDNLNLNRDSRNSLIWESKEFQIGSTSYLVSATIEEVLLNEKNFQKIKKELSNIDEFSIESLGRFQTVKLHIVPSVSLPEFASFNGVINMGRRCDNGEITIACICNYKISRPIDSYMKFTDADDWLPKFNVQLNNETGVEQTGRSWQLDLRLEDGPVNMKFEFDKYIDSVQIIKGQAMGPSCINEPNEKSIIKSKINYKVEIEILGTSKSEKDFGLMPYELIPSNKLINTDF